MKAFKIEESTAFLRERPKKTYKDVSGITHIFVRSEDKKISRNIEVNYIEQEDEFVENPLEPNHYTWKPF